MKKITFITIITAGLAFAACGTKDTKNEAENYPTTDTTQSEHVNRPGTDSSQNGAGDMRGNTGENH